MSKRIRVCEIVFSLDIEAAGGGITRFVSALIQALDPERFEPMLWGLWDRGSGVEKELAQRLAQGGIQTITGTRWDEKHPYRSFYNAYRNLRECLKRQPVDILHSHSEFSDVVAMILKLEGIAPVIIRTLHNGFPIEWRRRPVRRLFLSYLLFPLLYDREIGVSAQITGYLNQRWLAKILGRTGLTLHNAVDLSRFKEPTKNRGIVRRELGVPLSAYMVGTVGRLGEEKGYDLLIQAAAQISGEIDDLYVVIIGDGKLASALRKQASETGISHRVIFTGARSDIERLLGSMDLFVCSSRWEGLSTAVLEAMAAGVPVVATDIPGNRELLSDGKNAWVVPAENAQALAGAILNAKSNPERGREFSQQARADVLHHGIGPVAAQYSSLYQNLDSSQQS